MKLVHRNLTLLPQRGEQCHFYELILSLVCEQKTNISSHLLEIPQNQKQSQQKKFELGDLKELFNNQDFSNPDLELYRNHARESWKVFLKDFAALSVQRNQKIKCGVTKQNYLNYIPILIEELDQMFPYDKLLSKYKLPSANPEMINTDDMIQLDSDPLYSTIKEIV